MDVTGFPKTGRLSIPGGGAFPFGSPLQQVPETPRIGRGPLRAARGLAFTADRSKSFGLRSPRNGVTAAWVVPTLDELEERPARLGLGTKRTPFDDHARHCGEQALDHGGHPGRRRPTRRPLATSSARTRGAPRRHLMPRGGSGSCLGDRLLSDRPHDGLRRGRPDAPGCESPKQSPRMPGPAPWASGPRGPVDPLAPVLRRVGRRSLGHLNTFCALSERVHQNRATSIREPDGEKGGGERHIRAAERLL